VNVNVSKQTVGVIALSEAQIQGSAAAQEFHNSLPSGVRYSEENIEKATLIAEQEKKALIANTINPMPVPEDSIGASNGDDKFQKMVQKRYLIAITRVAANKIDAPEFEPMDFLEILAVLAFREQNRVPTIDEWVKQLEIMVADGKKE
jgi:hypothetical protein